MIISALFIPQYFRGEMYTAYQLIERRFGRTLHSLTAGLFLVTRAAAEGVRVFAVSIVVAIAIGTGEVASIAIITLLTMIYTFEGGMAAVIWTDVVQTVIYVGGTLVGFFTILHAVPGGWTAVHAMADAAGKFRVFDFSPVLHKTYTFWAGIIGGTFLTTASHGTDQLMVQRLLSARSERQSKAALLSSGVAILFQFTLFLVVGVMLFAFYRGVHPAGSSDRIFPTFIVQHMPHGISGLLIAAILAAAMSNLSAALNSLSSTSIVDFYLRRNPDMQRKAAGGGFAAGDDRMGAGAVRAGAGVAARRAGGGGRAVDRVGGVRSLAGCVPAGHADAARQPARGDCRDGLRTRGRNLCVDGDARAVDVVRGDRHRGHLPGGIRGQRGRRKKRHGFTRINTDQIRANPWLVS